MKSTNQLVRSLVSSYVKHAYSLSSQYLSCDESNIQSVISNACKKSYDILLSGKPEVSPSLDEVLASCYSQTSDCSTRRLLYHIAGKYACFMEYASEVPETNKISRYIGLLITRNLQSISASLPPTEDIGEEPSSGMWTFLPVYCSVITSKASSAIIPPKRPQTVKFCTRRILALPAYERIVSKQAQSKEAYEMKLGYIFGYSSICSLDDFGIDKKCDEARKILEVNQVGHVRELANEIFLENASTDYLISEQLFEFLSRVRGKTPAPSSSGISFTSKRTMNYKNHLEYDLLACAKEIVATLSQMHIKLLKRYKKISNTDSRSKTLMISFNGIVTFLSSVELKYAEMNISVAIHEASQQCLDTLMYAVQLQENDLQLEVLQDFVSCANGLMFMLR